MKNLGFIAAVVLAAGLIGGAWGENIVRNGDFEADGDGDGMADHWQFAGDKGVAATWGRDAGFEGRFSQRISCSRFTSLSAASHAMLCQVETVRLERGKWYRLSFAARQKGISGGAVHVAISNTKSWTNCGLRESARLREKWKEFEFVFRATETVSEGTRLQFWYTSAGSLWLDDVRLEGSEPLVKRYTEVVAASEAVNLIGNSSFECGRSGWGSIADLPGWGGNLNLLVGAVDSGTGVFDGSSLKIALSPETMPVYYFDYFPLYRVAVKAPLAGNRGWITVEPGADYTLSAYMKGDCDGLVGVLSLRQAFGRALREEVRVSERWQRYAMTFRLRAGQVFAALGLDLEASKKESGTLWIDGVQLEKGPRATEYRPRASVEVGLETERPGNLFRYGQEPKIIASVFNSGRAARRVKLNVSTTDFDNAVVHRETVRLDVGPGEAARVPIETGAGKKGFYRLHVDAEGAEVLLTRAMRFAVIEPYARSDSLFGMNHAYPWDHLLDLSRQIGLCWFRDWSLKWYDIEPEKGSFDFRESDYQIDRVLGRGLNVLGLLPFPSANWSSSAGADVRPSGRYPESRERIAYMPSDLNDLACYVRKTVEHYHDRIGVWEILNEPVYTSYALPRGKGYKVEDYVGLLKTAYQSAKSADADCLVIGGIAGGPTTYTREFIGTGGLDWVDVLNLHAYPGLTAPEAYEGPLRDLRERMREAGAERAIWFTEGAYYADDDMAVEPHESTWLKAVDSEAEAAQWQVKFNTLLLAYGAEKIIYHSGTPGSLNNDSVSGIFFEWGGAPRKMVVSQAAMANLLVPPIKSLGPVSSSAMTKAYRFESGGRTVIVAWRQEGASAEAISPAEKGWRGVDLQGNEIEGGRVTLTERPVYFVAEGTRVKVLPW